MFKIYLNDFKWSQAIFNSIKFIINKYIKELIL